MRRTQGQKCNRVPRMSIWLTVVVHFYSWKRLSTLYTRIYHCIWSVQCFLFYECACARMALYLCTACHNLRRFYKFCRREDSLISYEAHCWCVTNSRFTYWPSKFESNYSGILAHHWRIGVLVLSPALHMHVMVGDFTERIPTSIAPHRVSDAR
jgi:hypothetical protein